MPFKPYPYPRCRLPYCRSPLSQIVISVTDPFPCDSHVTSPRPWRSRAPARPVIISGLLATTPWGTPLPLWYPVWGHFDSLSSGRLWADCPLALNCHSRYGECPMQAAQQSETSSVIVFNLPSDPSFPPNHPPALLIWPIKTLGFTDY